jgi:Fe-Mn family superoxide dismutase
MATFRSLRPLLRTPAALSAPTAFRRHLHERVPLAYALEGGVGSFLSPEALQTVAVDWQQGVLERLNELVRGASRCALEEEPY